MIFTIPPPTPKLAKVAPLRDNAGTEKIRAHGSNGSDGATSGLAPPQPPPQQQQSLPRRDEEQSYGEGSKEEDGSSAPAAEQSQSPPPQEEQEEDSKERCEEKEEASVAPPPSPPPEPQFLVQDHKLGVSVHSVHALINEGRAAFPSARREYQRARRNLRANSDNSGGGQQRRVAAAAAARLFSVTRALLLINADHGSAWNARKEVVQDGLYGSVRDEIKASTFASCFFFSCFVLFDVPQMVIYSLVLVPEVVGLCHAGCLLCAALAY